ncbi:MAG: NUDIX hydrolase [Cyanobacteria bacterium HKST-UBA04]|nr:NUDIX hydrolase [Cyanobacteria bacterium HKST-UBA04]
MTENMALQPETTLASRVCHEGVFLTVRHDTVRLANGLERGRDVVEHPGGVMVVPRLDDGRLLLIRQYRYALGDFLLEFPAGKIEPGEAPLQTIQRELEEETGYAADHWQPLTKMATAPGFCNEWIHVFYAHGLRQLAEAGGLEDEAIELVPMHPEAIQAAIVEGRLTDAKTICGFALVAGMQGAIV